MLLATVLALSAAVLHAGWNLVAKRAEGDRYLVLWAQFFAAGVLTLPLLIGYQLIWGMPWQGYMWAALSGCVHVPYMYLLAHAYNFGDFSISYPIARGAGAAFAAIGGVVALHDHLPPLAAVGIAIVVCGLVLLAYGAHGRSLAMALLAAVSIGLYSTIDGKGARISPNVVAFALATMAAGGVTNTVAVLILRRQPRCRRCFARTGDERSSPDSQPSSRTAWCWSRFGMHRSDTSRHCASRAWCWLRWRVGAYLAKAITVDDSPPRS